MAKNKSKIDLKNEFCSNENCNDYSKRDTANIVKYGHDKNGKQRFKCKTCGGVFVETKNTIFYNRKLSQDQIILICKLLEKRYYGIASGTMGTMRLVGQMLSMGITMLLFTVFIGRTQITPEYYSPFIESIKAAFMIFSVLCFAGIFASMARGKVH